MRKILRAEVSVECDAQVTDEDVRAIIFNQMADAPRETAGGHVNWHHMSVRRLNPQIRNSG